MSENRVKKVVIIDDVESIRTLLCLIFKRRGYEVESASEPFFCPIYLDHECTCLKDQVCADIVITDYNMPNMTGLEFVKNQKTLGCMVENLAVMSAGWQESDLEYVKNLGCKTFNKPFKMKELIQWLEECEKRM